MLPGLDSPPRRDACAGVFCDHRRRGARADDGRGRRAGGAGGDQAAADQVGSQRPLAGPERDRHQGRRRPARSERQVPVPGRPAGPVVRQQRLPAPVLRRQPDQPLPRPHGRPLRRVLRARARPGPAQRPPGGGGPHRAVQHPGPEAPGGRRQHPPPLDPDGLRPRRRRGPPGLAGLRHQADHAGHPRRRRPGAAGHAGHRHRLGQHRAAAGRPRRRRVQLPRPHARGAGADHLVLAVTGGVPVRSTRAA